MEDFRFKDCYFVVETSLRNEATCSVGAMKEMVYRGLDDDDAVRVKLFHRSRGRLIHRYNENPDIFFISCKEELDEVLTGLTEVLQLERVAINNI